jgi:signal transduction histidine kinase
LIRHLKKYQIGIGLVASALLTVSIVPIRLSEGQGADITNLVGSEIVIYLLFMTCWMGIQFIQQQTRLRNWQKIVFSVVLCMGLSIVFYHASNPFFEDYPLAPIRKNTFWIGMLRLSIRGILISVMLVPFIFYVDYARKRQNEKIETEKRHARDLERRNQLLEQTVSERTMELKTMLSDLSRYQKELDNQIYLQSRLLASITHDIQGPFNYVLFVSRNINQLINEQKFEQLPEFSQVLENSLESMFVFLNNLLEFSKTQIKNEAVHLSPVNLSELMQEKASLFQGVIKSKGNQFRWDIDNEIEVNTNSNLFAIVVHNLLDNAAKYTEHGSIYAYTTRIGHETHLVIENTGPGLPEQVVNWLNDTGRSTDQPMLAPSQRVGIGLLLIVQITALLNMKFFIQPEPGKTKASLALGLIK